MSVQTEFCQIAFDNDYGQTIFLDGILMDTMVDKWWNMMTIKCPSNDLYSMKNCHRHGTKRGRKTGAHTLWVQTTISGCTTRFFWPPRRVSGAGFWSKWPLMVIAPPEHSEIEVSFLKEAASEWKSWATSLSWKSPKWDENFGTNGSKKPRFVFEIWPFEWKVPRQNCSVHYQRYLNSCIGV